jgi:hypothetical protein
MSAATEPGTSKRGTTRSRASSGASSDSRPESPATRGDRIREWPLAMARAGKNADENGLSRPLPIQIPADLAVPIGAAREALTVSLLAAHHRAGTDLRR